MSLIGAANSEGVAVSQNGQIIWVTDVTDERLYSFKGIATPSPTPTAVATATPVPTALSGATVSYTGLPVSLNLNVDTETVLYISGLAGSSSYHLVVDSLDSKITFGMDCSDPDNQFVETITAVSSGRAVVLSLIHI